MGLFHSKTSVLEHPSPHKKGKLGFLVTPLQTSNKFIPHPLRRELLPSAFYILILLFFQCFFLPNVFGENLYFDLVTPWLIIIFVYDHSWRAVLLSILAAVTIETQGAIPFGLYMCAYWVLGTLLFFVRSHISWQNFFPWLVVIICSQIWIIGVEELEGFLKVGFFSSLAPEIFFYQWTRIILATLIGIFMIWNWHILESEENIS